MKISKILSSAEILSLGIMTVAAIENRPKHTLVIRSARNTPFLMRIFKHSIPQAEIGGSRVPVGDQRQ
jgi:hypothetical protein